MEAVARSGLDFEALSPEQRDRAAVVINTGGGGMEMVINGADTIRDKGPGQVSPFAVPALSGSMAAAQVSMTYGITGPVITQVAACASGVIAYQDALRLIASGECDIVLSGGSEAPLLTVEAVSRDYATARRGLFGRPGRLRAVDGVSFRIEAGERVGLVGESGCGKSTLTRAILGLEAVQEGRIALGGAPVFDGPRANRAVRRRMQVVFQDPYGSFNPRHRVARLITEPFHLMDAPPRGAARAAAIAEALSAVGLSPADADKYIHEFSGGQRQRIAIARALIIRPDLIILDEAVSALDVSVRAQILDLLADLSARYHLAYLFISHDLTVVRTITDRVLVMQAGRIVEAGPTAQVLARPSHPYTRKLIAAAPKLPVLDGVPAG
jgi:peptide/nickel transport system ATP-binding protein